MIAGIFLLGILGSDAGPIARSEGPFVPLLSDDRAWAHLPEVSSGTKGPLPAWARALARSLPRTTAAMLDLDRLHRTQSPLGPLLRGKMRWVAARANESPYGLAYAEADLKRAGLDEAGLQALRDGAAGAPESERAALAFANQMTVNGSAVTDKEVATLIAHHGPENVTAMVLLLAYANFQDRLLLALGITGVEEGGPLEPLDVRFARTGEPPAVPERTKPEGTTGPATPERIDDPEWALLKIEDLKRQLQTQRAKPGRVRVPTWEEVLAVLPDNARKPEKPIRIQWSLVCMGYQPRLAAAWSACTRAFGEEAKQDRVFEESLFWVVTRTIHCFY